jgi:hypothetical protein
MPISRRLSLKCLLTTTVAAAVLGAGSVPAAHAGPKTLTDSTTTTTTTTKDTKTTSTGRKVG